MCRGQRKERKTQPIILSVMSTIKRFVLATNEQLGYSARYIKLKKRHRSILILRIYNIKKNVRSDIYQF